MKPIAVLAATLLVSSAALAADAPSRPAFEGCKWEKFSDPKLGLDAWFQRCTLEGRTVDLIRQGPMIVQRYSDDKSGKPEPVIEVFDVQPNERPENAVKRIFAVHTDAKLAKRCVLELTKKDVIKQRNGASRWNFVPDAKYQKELDKKQSPDDGIPDPPCGNYGVTYDSVEYWEVQPGAHHVIYVHAGQDDPMFDEETVRLK